MNPMIDSREAYISSYPSDLYSSLEADWQEYEAYLDGLDNQDDVWYDDEDDGQPSEYTEWQDFQGGDDWDQGQYDSDF